MSVIAEKNGVRREFDCGQWSQMGGTSSGWAVISSTCGHYSENIRAPYASYGYENGVGDKHYTHVQPSAASVWTCNHGLGKKPSVRVIDTAGTRVKPVVVDIDNNVTELHFYGGGSPAAMGGEAYFN
jgi:hypothetical protein